MTMKYLITTGIIALLTLSGCNEKEDKSTSSTTQTVTQSGSITVISPGNKTSETNKDQFRTLDIRGESIIKYAPEGQEITKEVKNVQVVVAARNSPYGSIHARLMQQRLSKDFIVLCSACHDDYANGVIGPSLIGKNEKEVREMIDKYSKEPDANVLMTSLVERMTSEEIDFIAKDIAKFNQEIQKQKSDVNVDKLEEKK